MSNLITLPYSLTKQANDALGGGVIKTGAFPSFDKRCNVGGPARGQVFCIAGYSGFGKSTFLRTLGGCALYQGFPVIHYTIGDLTEVDVLAAYASLLTTIPVNDIRSNPPLYQHYAAQLTANRWYLRVKEFLPRRVTIDSMRSHLTEVRSADGISPGLIIVDFPDRFKASNPKEDQWTNEVNNVDELVSISKEFDCVVWWALQPKKVNKQGARVYRDGNEVLTMDDGRGMADKAHYCDGWVSLNQTLEEFGLQRARLWVDKLRHGKKWGDPINLATQFSISKIGELGSV
jgi:hypothetical protein